MPLSLTGITVSKGIAIGKARVQQHGQLDIVEYVLPEEYIEEEIARFSHALQRARGQLKLIRSQIPGNTPRDIAAFIDTHLLMLEDAALSSVPIEIIREHRCNAEWALKLQQDALVQVFDAMEDPYLRTRRDDIDHVVHRIQQLLLHEDHMPSAIESDRNEPRIIIAVDLAPSDLVLLHNHNIAAIVTERGGPMSHTAILARSLGIPALVGVAHVHQYIDNDEPLVVDANNGALLAGLDEPALAFYRRQQRHERQAQRALQQLKSEPSLTLDGVPIKLRANIELSEDITAMRRVGAEGVGLYRTEFLFMNRESPPSEEEQFETYRHTVKRLKGAPLTIRTLDLGADKEIVPGSSSCTTNPALGLRAIRLCLQEPELFLPQLRAILRASAYGPVRILIPMLTTPEEIPQVLGLLNRVKNDLKREKKRFDPEVMVGGMIEVPAAAICADIFAAQLDFLSIGTNDLMQYTLATDRIDETVNHLFNPLNIGVLRLIDTVLRAGQRAGTPVAMCGEMAGDPALTPLLLALGLTEFSMPPAALLEVKRIIRLSDTAKLKRQLGKLLHSQNAMELSARLSEINHGHKNLTTR
jgi:phosphoenolpyruvate-protein phosphotransferase (PTS system enzyme I)